MSRRTMLRGLGTAIALPMLEAMIPSRLLGAEAKAAVGAATPPRRLAWIYVPNGVHMPDWTPARTGFDYELSPTLQPLAALKAKMTVISGLVCQRANANGDGPGDHARAMAAYLTGRQAVKTEGANIRAGKSADQAAADQIGHLTKFRSLELGIEEGRQVGHCDVGYSCTYSHTLSWRNDTTPLVKDCDPQSVFDRLFSNRDPLESAESRARREGDHLSILDFVLTDAKRLQRDLGYTDRQKMDEYLTAVREVETRIAQATRENTPVPAGARRPQFDYSASNRSRSDITTRPDYPVHVSLMVDMAVLAFQTDLTRILTLPFADEQSNQTYAWVGANVPHHATSHHQGNSTKQAMLAKINVCHIKLLADLLTKLDRITESDGRTILDNSLIAYGSGNSDGDRHNHDNLPTLLFGQGGGTVTAGRHVRHYGVPVNNLWLSMLDHAGAPVKALGDSTGRLPLA